MENGGKRKRAGLSLKSFKKPALNYVKQPPVAHRFAKASSNKGKPNSRLEKSNLAGQGQIIETPISENRMKLLNLMPKFPQWESMVPFPLNPWMKSLTESKSEISDNNTDISVSNGNIAKKIENESYSDLPMHGFHCLFHQIKTRLVPSYESDMKTDTTASEIEINSTEMIEPEFGHAESKAQDFKCRSVSKGGGFKVDVNHNRKKEDKFELGNVLGSTEEPRGTPNQRKPAAVRIDLTDDIEGDFNFDFDGFEGSSGKNLNIATGMKDDRVPNLSKSQSIGACVSGNEKNSASRNRVSVDERSAWNRDKTKFVETIRETENKKMMQYEFSCREPITGKPHTNISKANSENTVYNDNNVVIPNSPPRGNRKIAMKSRQKTVHKDPHLQGARSVGTPGRQNMSKVNSSTEVQALRKSESKSSRPEFKRVSKIKSSNQHDNARIILDKTVNKTNDNSSMFSHNENKLHVEASNSFEKSVFTNKGFSKVNRLDNTTKKDQLLYAKNTQKTSANIGKSNSMYNNSLQTEVRGGSYRETSFSGSKGISKANTFYSSTRRSQPGHTIGKTPQSNKTNKKQNSNSTTYGKQTYLQSSERNFAFKNISKKDAVTKTTNNLRASGGNCGPSKDTEGGLGSDEDLFGSDDGLDELLAKSFTDDWDYTGEPGTQGDNDDSKWAQNDDGMKDFLGNLDDDIDDDTLVACCDDILSPTISVREKNPSSGRPSRNEVKKSVKRKLNIPDAQSKIRRPNIPDNVDCSRADELCEDKADESIRECPFCAKSFHSGFSKGDIDQHIAMCCSTEDIGTDDVAFW